MTRIKMHISNVKLPFYPPCEIKCGLQNRVSTPTDLELHANPNLREKRPIEDLEEGEVALKKGG